MRYKLSDNINRQFILEKEYYSFKDVGKFLELFFGSYDERFIKMDVTLNIFDIQETDIPPPEKGSLNVLFCYENCVAHSWYKHHQKYGDYGDKNIQIYLYNHIDEIVETDDYIAIPLLWFRLAYFEKYYQDHKPSIIRRKEQQQFGILTTDNFRNGNIKKSLYETVSRVGKTYFMRQFKQQIQYESIYSTNFLDFINNFRFAILSENSSAPGYITEKLFLCYHARVIPIYYGNDPERYFNEDSFINAKNMTLEQIYEKVKYLNENDKAYRKMINKPKLKKTGVDYFGELHKFLLRMSENNENEEKLS